MCCKHVNYYLEENGIEVREYAAVSSDVALLASNQLNGTQVELKNDMEINPSEIDITRNGAEETEENTFDLIWADPGSCCYALYSKLDTDKVLLQPSPLALAKAIKVAYVLSIMIWPLLDVVFVVITFAVI